MRGLGERREAHARRPAPAPLPGRGPLGLRHDLVADLRQAGLAHHPLERGLVEAERGRQHARAHVRARRRIRAGPGPCRPRRTGRAARGTPRRRPAAPRRGATSTRSPPLARSARGSVAVQRPSRPITTGSVSWPPASSPSSTAAPDRSETSCSLERPPASDHDPQGVSPASRVLSWPTVIVTTAPLLRFAPAAGALADHQAVLRRDPWSASCAPRRRSPRARGALRRSTGAALSRQAPRRRCRSTRRSSRSCPRPPACRRRDLARRRCPGLVGGLLAHLGAETQVPQLVDRVLLVCWPTTFGTVTCCGPVLTNSVTEDPRSSAGPAPGSERITSPLARPSPTPRGSRRRAAAPASSERGRRGAVSPTTSGIFTVVGPLETISVTVESRSTFVPAPGT